MSDRELFRVEQLPVLQNRVFPTADEARRCVTGDVVLVQEARTGLVVNRAFDPGLLNYDENYQNEQACSSVFRTHLERVGDVLARHFSGKILEVGCGKGFFLELLRAKGYDAWGVDPSYEGESSYVIKKPFDRALGLSADGIVLRHVLEHIPDPIAFLAEVAAANGGRGLIYIEVPCFDWILAHRAWFDIFYEHVNYFRREDFVRLFGRVVESGHLFFGQYLYVVADLASFRPDDRGAMSEIAMPSDFFDAIDRTLDRVRRMSARRVAVWGGSSKGVLFSLYAERAGVRIDEVIDINPAKQGRFLPGTGLRVASPEGAMSRMAADDVVVVMNSNYLDEIVARSSNRFSYLSVDHEQF